MAVDDFGLHAGINEAALHLAAMGRVHAIGCMVGGKAWAAGARLIHTTPPGRVDLGLHLDLTETPLGARGPVSLKALIGDSLLRRLDRRSIREEIGAQIERFEQAVGQPPAYVDGHQHVHQLPMVRDELIAELGVRYGGRRPWIRSTRRPRLPGAQFKPWVIELLGAHGLESLARRSGYFQNRHLLGVYDFEGGTQRYGRILDDWLVAARDGDLLMCHPSMADAADDALSAARRSEFEVLSGVGLEVTLLRERITLMPMSTILHRAAA
jgi:predicted glycoside hydrolase/deacetylase ChbG (UPF0249 family)